MNNQKQIVLTVMTIAIMAVAVISASFAFFSSQVQVTNTANFSAALPSGPKPFVAVGSTCTMSTINASAMQQGAVNATVAKGTASNCNLTVNYASPTTDTMSCTYDVMWQWTSANIYNGHSKTTCGGSTAYTGKEFTIKGAGTAATGKGTMTHLYSTETDFANITTAKTAVKLGSGNIIANSTTNSTHTWTFTMKLYNVPACQDWMANQTYTGKIFAANVVC